MKLTVNDGERHVKNRCRQFQQAGEFHPLRKRKGKIPPFIFGIQFLDQVVKAGLLRQEFMYSPFWGGRSPSAG